MCLNTRDTLGVLVLILGTLVNSFSLTFFASRPDKGATEAVFIALNTVDLVICGYLVGAIPAVRQTGAFYLSSRLQDHFFYLSTFLTCLLCAVRMVVLVCPVAAPRIIKVRFVLLSIAVFLVLLALPFLIHPGYFLEQGSARLVGWPLYYTIMTLIVVIVALICAILVRVVLRRDENLTEEKRRGSETILIITTTYIVFVLPYCLVHFFYLVRSKRRNDEEYTSLDHLDATYVEPALELYSHLAVPLNSTINGVIYFCRIKELRNFTVKALSKLIHFGCRGKEEEEEEEEEGREEEGRDEEVRDEEGRDEEVGVSPSGSKLTAETVN